MAHKLQNLSKDITNDRLKELIQETEIVCSKLKDGTDVWYDDIDNLKGCLQSLRDAKAKSFEDEEKERLEEERRKAEEQRKRREEEEIKRKEREEQERKEKEERERRYIYNYK
jgi:hypothetical protein